MPVRGEAIYDWISHFDDNMHSVNKTLINEAIVKHRDKTPEAEPRVYLHVTAGRAELLVQVSECYCRTQTAV